MGRATGDPAAPHKSAPDKMRINPRSTSGCFKVRAGLKFKDQGRRLEGKGGRLQAKRLRLELAALGSGSKISNLRSNLEVDSGRSGAAAFKVEGWRLKVPASTSR